MQSRSVQLRLCNRRNCPFLLPRTGLASPPLPSRRGVSSGRVLSQGTPVPSASIGEGSTYSPGVLCPLSPVSTTR
ncbi:hypothetical protein NDU88_004606 [Pleurodeles waltl]|uniref:Uncharacterized protein n=1 Tax=Pleurodeles waltl TaxID=8319 RepID=A0AAV7L0S3_PLEWA|nr:hypothetical protein NDU88_004606 [Pleurodeles waltl]